MDNELTPTPSEGSSEEIQAAPSAPPDLTWDEEEAEPVPRLLPLSETATLALVMGIFSIIFAFAIGTKWAHMAVPCGLVAILSGGWVMREARGEDRKNWEMARAGLIGGSIGVALGLVIPRAVAEQLLSAFVGCAAAYAWLRWRRRV